MRSGQNCANASLRKSQSGSRPKIAELWRPKDWQDLGALKAELLDMAILGRNAYAKMVVQDIKAQRRREEP